MQPSDASEQGRRRRAIGVSMRALVLSAGLAAGCVTNQPLRVTDLVNLPQALVSDACMQGHEQGKLVTVEHAELVFYDDVPLGLDCTIYDFSAGNHIRTHVDFREPSAAVSRIRDYLVSNGVRVPRERIL